MKLCVLVGTPLSGKSTFARNLVETDPQSNWEILSYDIERTTYCNAHGIYYKDSFTEERSKAVTAMWHRKREILIENKANIIMDSTNLTVGSRSRLSSLFEGYPMFSVDIETDYEECLRRNLERSLDRRIPEKVICEAFHIKRTPTKDEGFFDCFTF